MHIKTIKKWMLAHRWKTSLGLSIILLLSWGLWIPEKAMIPVQGATARDWNPKSFWYEPWGASGVHKGIDIFAPEGRPVLSAVSGIVLFQGDLRLGGHVIAVLGPKWRIHYYAHLADSRDTPFFVRRGTIIGAVGSSGNAKGKPPHLHYSVISIIPAPWRFSLKTQGWKQMFFLNPEDVFRPAP